MSLQDTINALIKEEITNDPYGIGYSKAVTDSEIATMLNSGFTHTVTNIVTEQTPISRILSGVAFAPNVVEAKDVTDAKTIV